MNWHLIIVAISACAFTTPVAGQSIDASCTVPEAKLVQSGHFPELQLKALDLNKELCGAFSRGVADGFEADQHAHYLNFAMDVRDAATAAFAGISIKDLSIPFDRFVADASESEPFGQRLPSFRVEPSDDPREWLMFHFDDRGRAGRISAKQDNAACRARFHAGCDAVLDDLANAINFYKYSYASLTAAESVDRLDRMSDRWDEFLDTGRSQTLLDLSLTSALERKHFQRGSLVPPPKRQWTVLHPDLAYEHVRQARAGQRDALTVVIEWFGVNWWSSDSPLANTPFGVSLVSVYADRPDVDSAGHGLVMHFDNKYSVGWTSRGGSDGFFISIDLLRLIDNKRERLERYRQKLSRVVDYSTEQSPR